MEKAALRLSLAEIVLIVDTLAGSLMIKDRPNGAFKFDMEDRKKVLDSIFVKLNMLGLAFEVGDKKNGTGEINTP